MLGVDSIRTEAHKRGHLVEKELVVCEVIFWQRKREECSLGLGCECWMAYRKSELYSFEEGSFCLAAVCICSPMPVSRQYV